MNYNTHEFLLIFLPVTLVAFALLPPRGRVPLLCLGSILFYGASGLVPLAFMLASIVWGWGMAFVVAGKKTKGRIVLAISFPLLVLYFFKYLNFTLTAVSASDATRDWFYPILSVVLPAGISFYTFELISYVVDVADGKLKPEKSLLKLTTFFALYPHLIAGPIMRYQDLREGINAIATTKKIPVDLAKGFKFFSIGLFAKIFAADFLYAACMDKMRPGVALSRLDALYNVLAYSFRIYYDFWSYSLMAMGLGWMISLKIARNFEQPYLSENPKEFWRRWHMTLSYWLRDYIYLRLGGNKSYVRNIAVVFLLAGIWHGAGWNFIAWGAYHGVLVASYHWLKNPWHLLPRPLRIALNFSLVSLGWPLFYLDLPGFKNLLVQMAGFGPAVSGGFRPLHWAFLAVIAFVTFAFREESWLYNETPRPFIDSPVLHAALCFFALVFFSFGVTFIYFQF